MLQQDITKNLVIATGLQYSARDFVNAAAKKLDMQIRGEGRGRCGLRCQWQVYRGCASQILSSDRSGNPSWGPWRSQRKTWQGAEAAFNELVAKMVRADLQSAGRDELVKRYGYKAITATNKYINASLNACLIIETSKSIN